MPSIHVCTSLQVTGLLACSVEEIRRFSDRRHFHFSCGFGPEITCDLFSPRHTLDRLPGLVSYIRFHNENSTYDFRLLPQHGAWGPRISETAHPSHLYCFVVKPCKARVLKLPLEPTVPDRVDPHGMRIRHYFQNHSLTLPFFCCFVCFWMPHRFLDGF